MMKLYKLHETSVNTSLGLGKAAKLVHKAKTMVDRIARHLLKTAAHLELRAELLSDYDEKSRMAEIKVEFGGSEIYPQQAIVKIRVYDTNDIGFILPKPFARSINNDQNIVKFKSERAAQNFLKSLYKRAQ